MHDAYRATFDHGLLETRLAELLRLRSAQAGGCVLCASSRNDESVTDEQAACLLEPDPNQFSSRELAALQFLGLLAYDHLRIDVAVYRKLGEHFTPAEWLNPDLEADPPADAGAGLASVEVSDGEPVGRRRGRRSRH